MTQRRSRPYSRLDRVNEAVREVVAEELELVDDDRLQLVTITGVKVTSDLRQAHVWFSALTASPPQTDEAVDEAGADSKDPVAAALAHHRVRLQAAVARQLRLKRTPELDFSRDPAIAAGTRVEDILRRLRGGRKDES